MTWTTRCFLLLIASLMCACRPLPPKATSALPQRAYLWQREWTASVNAALSEADSRLAGVVVLGAEITWSANKNPSSVRANIDWDRLRNGRIPYAIALRVGPYSGPFSADDAAGKFVITTGTSLVQDAARHGVHLSELELDFDCAKRNLSDYRNWVRAVREAIRPVPLCLTTLPDWLDDPAFGALAKEADTFVLQVHSIPLSGSHGQPALFHADEARAWITNAAKFHIPFEVALPTYRCSAGYDSNGKLLSVAMDAVQPAWPPATHVLQLAAEPDELAAFVNQIERSHPAELKGIIWYRLPVSTDVRNWRWPTLSAVMSGRAPRHEITVSQEGENPVDISMRNAGEAEETLDRIVTASWTDGKIVAADALPGWTVELSDDHATFRGTPANQIVLSPGAERKIGWLRFERVPNMQLHLSTR